MRRKKLFNRPAKTKMGCKMIEAADNMPKDNTGSLSILSMVRDCTVRFQRLKRAGVNISGLSCGL